MYTQVCILTKFSFSSKLYNNIAHLFTQPPKAIKAQLINRCPETKTTRSDGVQRQVLLRTSQSQEIVHHRLIVCSPQLARSPAILPVRCILTHTSESSRQLGFVIDAVYVDGLSLKITSDVMLTVMFLNSTYIHGIYVTYILLKVT